MQGGLKRKAKVSAEEEEVFSESFLEIPESHEPSTVSARLKTLEKVVIGKGGLEQRLEEFEAQLADLANEYCVLQKTNSELKRRNDFLEAVVVKQDKEIAELKRAKTDAVTRSMRNNIMIHNVKEKSNEVPEAVVRNFLVAKNILSEEQAKNIRFDRVHRMGTHTRDRNRPIVARVTFYKDKELILNQWKATGKSDRGQPRVTQQFPPETMAKRAQQHHQIEGRKAEAKGSRDELKITRKADKVYINQELMQPDVSKPPLSLLFALDEDDHAKGRKLPHAFSPTVTEQGSVFQAEAVQVKSISEVRLAYQHLLTCPQAASATHNIMAYKVGGKSGWEDDGEFGAGRFLTHWINDCKMENICIFVTRQYGGERLGARRFELQRDTAKAACTELSKHLKVHSE